LCADTKGIKTLSNVARTGIGIHVEIPLTGTNFGDAPEAVAVTRRLGSHSVIISGGWLAMGDLKPRDEDVAEVVPAIKKSAGAMHCSFFFSFENAFRPVSGNHIEQGLRASSPRADTNNPLLFRRCRNDKISTLFFFMPFTLKNNRESLKLAPVSAAAMKGFIDILGYPGKIIDLDIRAKLKLRTRGTVINRIDIGSDSTRAISHEDAANMFSGLISPDELQGAKLLWICSRYELFHAFDVTSYMNLTTGLADYLKKSSQGAVTAVESDGPVHSDRYSFDYVCKATFTAHTAWEGC